MNNIERKGDIIILRSGGKDEWKAVHAIRDALITNPQDLLAAQIADEARTAGQTEVAASEETISIQVGGKDENRTFDEVTAHFKSLAQSATP